MVLRHTITVFTTLIAVSLCLKLSSIQKPYDKGIKAYKSERWTECIAQFEEAVQLYKLYKSTIINCRLQCNSEPFNSLIKEDIADLKLYEVFINRKDCITKCKDKYFNELHLLDDIDETLLMNLEARKPYEYLHMCYFEMYALPKAASAAYTYLVANPGDDTMKNNVAYYIEQPEVDPTEVVDLQGDDYTAFYKHGLSAYKEGNWVVTAASMEEVITDYLASESACRVQCERQPAQEWSPEISITISNNIAALLHCQQQCQEKLKILNYNSGLEFLADVLNYIQISYYRLDRIDDAAKAVATYLMILPTDEDMLENKKIYYTLTDPKAFTERSDIYYYFKRDKYEKDLLQLFHKGNNYSSDSNAI